MAVVASLEVIISHISDRIKDNMDPEEKKIVKIPVWDIETDEIIEMEIDQETLDAMDAADREVQQRIEEDLRREMEKFQFVRDDD